MLGNLLVLQARDRKICTANAGLTGRKLFLFEAGIVLPSYTGTTE